MRANANAHANVARNMDGRIPQMPGDMLDRNNNGTFELNETSLEGTCSIVVDGSTPGECAFTASGVMQ